jgi:hypothetical protein
MGHVLGSRTELKHRQNLGEGIDSQPEPEHLCGAAQPGSEFIQLEMREVYVAEAALMEELSVLACTREPPRDGGLTVTEDPLGSGWVQPFGQRGEHHGDMMRRGFQTIQGRIEPGSEGSTASLAAEGLNLLSRAMLAIANQRMSV